MINLDRASALLKVLADPNRLRLLRLLEAEELTVAELAAVTLLAQPRVSTHLARLRDHDLVRDRKAGVQCYYRSNGNLEEALGNLWNAVSSAVDDALITADTERLPAVLSRRARAQGWADSVAGDMERHYSPGRSWESTARSAVRLLDLGDVLDVASGDGVLAELLAPWVQSVTCVDVSESVIRAAQARLKVHDNASVERGDMHQLPFADDRFDAVLLHHGLTYTDRPQTVVDELARVTKPGGRVLLTTLNQHDHESAVAPYDHVNFGHTTDQLKELARGSGLININCQITSRETRPPHFEVVTLLGRKPES